MPLNFKVLTGILIGLGGTFGIVDAAAEVDTRSETRIETLIGNDVHLLPFSAM